MVANATALEISVDSYCTMSHIEAYLPHRTINASSQPSILASTNFARAVFNRINGVLNVLGYTLPVASGNTSAMHFLGDLNAMAAASKIEGAVYSYGNTEESRVAKTLSDSAEMIFISLQKGKTAVPGNAAREGA